MLEKGAGRRRGLYPPLGGGPGGILASMLEVTSTFVRVRVMAFPSPKREGLAPA
jgi:hypothetical protein